MIERSSMSESTDIGIVDVEGSEKAILAGGEGGCACTQRVGVRSLRAKRENNGKHGGVHRARSGASLTISLGSEP